MTGQSDITPFPIVLIDEFEDGMVDETAWVEAIDSVPDKATAIKVVEGLYPLDDRCNDDEEKYVCTGSQEWLYPENVDYADECPWPKCGPGDMERPGRRKFWVVNVEAAL